MPDDAEVVHRAPARARKALAETRLDEIRLQVDLGELRDAEAFEAAIAAAAGEFVAMLNRLESSVAMAFGLSADTKSALRAWLDGERRDLVEALRKRLEACGDGT